MVDNGLGVTMLPEMALNGGILEHTNITARPLQSDHAWRDIALVWRKNSPREKEFHLLSEILRDAAEHPAIRANAA
jgi:LysR family hydrogen peroxide-inducible transcriptional activator